MSNSGTPIPITGTGETLSWHVEARGGEKMVVQLRGEINENADFTELRRQLRGDVELQLDGITRINSCGVREWVNFVRELPDVDALSFARCAPTVVAQLNTIYNFRGPARVQSFLAPYVCEVCHIDEYKLLDVAEHFPDRSEAHVPAFRCPRCGGVMMFDELPERYLAFLVEPDHPGERLVVASDAALEDLKRVLEGAVDAAIILDQQHRVLYRNPAYDAYTGRRPREVATLAAGGTPCHELFNLEICAKNCIMKRAVEVGKPLRMHEIRARRGDGEDLTLIVTSTPLGDGLVVETYRDVTAESRVQRKYHALLAHERVAKEDLERKVNERTEALRRAQDQLVLNEKMSSLGRLVAGIAHELNNPINFVYGNVDFLAQYFRHLISLIALYESSPVPDELRQKADAFKQSIDFDFLMEDWERLLKSVRAGAERTAQIVAGLKTFSRPQVGKLEEADLAAGLETTLHLLQPLLRDRVTVHRAFAQLPHVRCRGGQVQQVFMNLLTNAAHAAGPGGEIFLDARPDGAGVRVGVRDTGPGVPIELASKIFDPFFTTKDVGEGTGLGLAISQRIVRSHGGRIELVAPQPGKGAEFVVWLPCHPPAELAEG